MYKDFRVIYQKVIRSYSLILVVNQMILHYKWLCVLIKMELLDLLNVVIMEQHGYVTKSVILLQQALLILKNLNLM